MSICITSIFLANFLSTIRAQSTKPFEDKYPHLDTVQLVFISLFFVQHFIGLLGQSLLIYVWFIIRKSGFKDYNFAIVVIIMDFAAGLDFSNTM
jgi:hypothetical protein